jgi:hypothetical protein
VRAELLTHKHEQADDHEKLEHHGVDHKPTPVKGLCGGGPEPGIVTDAVAVEVLFAVGSGGVKNVAAVANACAAVNPVAAGMRNCTPGAVTVADAAATACAEGVNGTGVVAEISPPG